MPPATTAPDPLTLPSSPRLEALQAQGQALGRREDMIRDELRTLYQDLHAFHEDPRPGREAEIDAKQARARVLEAERDVVHDEHIVVRRDMAQELDTLSGPLKAHVRATYIEALRAYLATIQAALAAKQRCHDVMTQSLARPGAGGTSLPTFHLTMPLAQHAKEIERWLA